MKVAVFKPAELPYSVNNYVDNVTRELMALGLDQIFFAEDDTVPEDADIYWDPRTGRPGPYRALLQNQRPLVVTFHGAANLALPFRECFGPGLRNLRTGCISRKETARSWRNTGTLDYTVIAVSEYAKTEFSTHINSGIEHVIPIYHGIDTRVFFSGGRTTTQHALPYLVHVSQFQPKKNVKRVLAAFDRLELPEKGSLTLVVPGFPECAAPHHTTVIRSPQNREQLSELYRGAIGFVFPSLHETFGMPILEAMASGCPVITAHDTGCAEVAGDAALLVNPRSVGDISGAMRRLITDGQLRASLQRKGLARAQEFTWRRSAEQHLAVFEDILSRSRVQ